MAELFWRWDRPWARWMLASVFGAVGYVGFGLLVGLPGTQLIGAALTGGVLASVMLIREWQAWDAGRALDGDARVAIIRRVRRGEGVTETRLVAAAVQWANLTRRKSEQTTRTRWLFIILIFLFFLGSGIVSSAVEAHDWTAVVARVLVGVGAEVAMVVVVRRQPGIAERAWASEYASRTSPPVGAV